MKSRYGQYALLLGVILLAVLFAPSIAIADTTDEDTTEGIDTDSTVISISIAEDGSAEVTFKYFTQLETAEEQDAFEQLEQDIEANNEEYISSFETQIGDVVATANAETDREMSVSDVSVTTATERNTTTHGTITYSFTWTAFAATTHQTLSMTDALTGFHLSDNTHLVVSAPEEYTVQSVSPTPTISHGNAVAWHGDTVEFGSDEPQLTFTLKDQASNGYWGQPYEIIALILIASIISLAAVVYTRNPSTGQNSEPKSDTSSSSLKSNEEQVRDLLAKNGGRMKQAVVAEELDWSAAKTSKVVKELRENNTVNTFRDGRENVVVLDK